MAAIEARPRAVIEDVTPQVDGGRFPAKGIVGESVTVEAAIFSDGHDLVAGALRYRPPGGRKWRSVPMEPIGDDRFQGAFPLGAPGPHQFVVEGWVDAFSTWAADLEKRIGAGQDPALELLVGAGIATEAADRAEGEDRRLLLDLAGRLPGPGGASLAADPEVRSLMRRAVDPAAVATSGAPLTVLAERERAVYGAWYERFPRGLGAPSRHGTLDDMRKHLPKVAAMGFDVLYLPPIHPIGRTGRKGPNNRTTARPGDPGSPWAIGAAEGGHTAIHPDLGNLQDFRRLVGAAREAGIEIALDIAFQCSPDHPWVTEHPEWFLHRPDGSIRHAENPPKQYEDIYPLNFGSDAWQSLWEALRDVVLFWADEGVAIFRVDNPHTKPFAFWEWLIAEVKGRHPDVLFLAEAFTRPRVMYRLAKLGFSQSYTYFAWRNTPEELRWYVEELTAPPVRDFFRPNFWPNTPDILTSALREGGRPAFAVRLVLAATLSASYGIYGPAFERLAHRGMENGTEEYWRSEKYEIRSFERGPEGDLEDLVTRVNAIRRENPALRRNAVTFHRLDNPALLAYSKRSPDGENTLLVLANLDPRHTQSGFTDLDLGALGLSDEAPFSAVDLLDGARYAWAGRRNYVELPPSTRPCHILRIEPAKGGA